MFRSRERFRRLLRVPNFCIHAVGRGVQRELTPGMTVWRRKALDEMTPAKWAQYLEQWKEKQEVARETGENLKTEFAKVGGGLDRMAVTKAEVDRVSHLLFALRVGKKPADGAWVGYLGN